MRQPIPSACSLSSGQREDRELEFRDLAASALLASERTPAGIRLRFDPAPAVRARVMELVRKEKECCPFFDFRLEASLAEFSLQVSAPPEAEPMLDELLRQFSPER